MKHKAPTILTIKQKNHEVKRLVAFGDSTTAGQELLDYNLPDGLFEKKKTMTHDKWSEIVKKNPKAMIQIRENKKRQQIMAWPGELSKLLNLEFTSYAEPGNSLERICYQITNTDFSKNDLIIIGLPPLERFLFFNEYDKNHEDLNVLVSMGLGIKDFDDGMLMMYNDTKILWEFMRNLCFLKSIKDTRDLDIYIVLQTEAFYLFNSPKILKFRKETFYKNIKPVIEELFLTSDLYIYDNEWEKRLEHGHVDLATHQRFALELIKRKYIYVTAD